MSSVLFYQESYSVLKHGTSSGSDGAGHRKLLGRALPSPPPGGHPKGRGAPGPALGGQLAQGVLAQAAVDVRVGVAERAPVRAPQRHLPLAGALLSAAGAPVVQGLGLGRVHGEGPAGPRAVIHGDRRGAAVVRNLPRDGDGSAGDAGLIARDALPAAAVGHERDGALDAGAGVKVRAGDVGDG